MLREVRGGNTFLYQTHPLPPEALGFLRMLREVRGAVTPSCIIHFPLTRWDFLRMLKEVRRR